MKNVSLMVTDICKHVLMTISSVTLNNAEQFILNWQLSNLQQSQSYLTFHLDE